MVKQGAHPKQSSPYALTWQAAGPDTKDWDGNDAEIFCLKHSSFPVLLEQDAAP